MHPDSLITLFTDCRNQTVALTEGLSAEDMCAQSMPDASPTKWHLAHTSWFFETFVLSKFKPEYQLFDAAYPHLFNSYYESAGTRFSRPSRGLLTRPAIDQIIAYRDYVDQQVIALLAMDIPSAADLIVIGLHHEMQHQELIMTDILHLFAHNPMAIPVYGCATKATTSATPIANSMQSVEAGIVGIGAHDNAFSYDNERPRHQYYLNPFNIAKLPVSNGEWLQFIADGGYQNPLLWLADGWSHCQMEQWQAPLYWRCIDSTWHQYGLYGLQKIEQYAPVCHISYYEADAYARWAGKRLPTEQEWEAVAAHYPIEGNFLEQRHWQPQTSASSDIQQLYGNIWEWTASAYAPYPGFKAAQGALSEYNGKFMANQFVLRGGSCVTPKKQMRASYRNFFYPQQRWQFSGARLAESI